MFIQKLDRDQYLRWGSDPDYRKFLCRRLITEHPAIQIRGPGGRILKQLRRAEYISEAATGGQTPPDANSCECVVHPDRRYGYHHPNCRHFSAADLVGLDP